MLAKIFETPIRDMSPHYILWRDYSIKDKTDILSNTKVENIYFVYEYSQFKHYWDILLTNGSFIKKTTTTTFSTTSIDVTKDNQITKISETLRNNKNTTAKGI